MRYLKIIYSKDLMLPCQIQYCEVDNEGYAIKIIEKDWCGIWGYAHENLLEGTNGVILPEFKMIDKSIETNCSLYHTCEIAKEEYYSIWDNLIQKS